MNFPKFCLVLELFCVLYFKDGVPRHGRHASVSKKQKGGKIQNGILPISTFSRANALTVRILDIFSSATCVD